MDKSITESSKDIKKVYVTNTLTGKKEELVPVEEGKIKMYACGVTVYDHCHIGHALQAIFFDVIRRFLSYIGYDVTYVRNYTDIDDKIINKAKEQGISPLKLSSDMIISSDEDMAAIGCLSPSFTPKVSEVIPDIINMVQTLIDKGYAYDNGKGDVYYRVRKKSDYGKLSHQNLDQIRSNSRELQSSDKEDELDFALWKADSGPDSSWSSPWGMGRPGWHIECSTMAKKFLGDSIDIHGGGRDLVFPHHENEIAQSEACNGVPFAKYWIHCGLLTINKQKMSKSLGNHLFIKDFLKSWDYEILRLTILLNNYSSNVDFSNSVFLNSHKRLYYYYTTCSKLEEIKNQMSFTDKDSILKGHEDISSLKEDFISIMCDDFNSCEAIARINKAFKRSQELLKLKKSASRSKTAGIYLDTFRELFGVFGLLTHPFQEKASYLKESLLPSLSITKEEIESLINERNQARSQKNYTLSDSIRDELGSKGIELMDTPSGTEWMINVDK